MLFSKCLKKGTSCVQFISRRQNRRLLFRCIAICLVIFFYYEVNVGFTTSINSMMSNAQGICRNSKNDNDDLNFLIQETHKILRKHHIDPFLCYGSLWGALRVNNPLPWDYDFDIGVLYDDLKAVDIDKLKKDFADAGIQIHYQYYFGNYKVKKGKMSGDIMIYVKNGKSAQRIGIESWLLFLHYRKYHSFPVRLIKRPLPTLKFAGIDYSVPREGIEIQKYLYPSSWWRVIKPRGCTFQQSTLQK